MIAYRRYAADNNVLPVPDNYDQHKQCRKYSIRTQLRSQMQYYIAGILILAGLIIIKRRLKRLRFPCREVGHDFLESAPLRFVNEVTINATPARVFEALEDPQAWPKWFNDIVKVEWTSPKPFSVGTTRTVRLKAMTVFEKFSVWETGKRFTFYFTETSLPFAHAFCEDYRLEDSGSGTTRLIYTVALEPRLLIRLGGPVSRLIMGRMFRNGARSLSAYMEK